MTLDSNYTLCYTECSGEPTHQLLCDECMPHHDRS